MSYLIFYLSNLMRTAAVAIIAVMACLAAYSLVGKEQTLSSREAFESWKNTHNIYLKMSEEQQEYRFRIFEKNLLEIREHNAKTGETYKMAVNQFTGLTKEEFKETYLSTFAPNPDYVPAIESETPANINVDWVSYGAVSPVKQQGQCTASYAFSAIGAIEGLSVIVYKQQSEYSAQEVVDCSNSYGNQGCISGSMISTFNFVRARGKNSLTKASTPRPPILTLPESSRAPLQQVCSRLALMEPLQAAPSWILTS